MTTQTWIQRQYAVPARRGMQLVYHGDKAGPVTVAITSCRNAGLYLRFPGRRRPVPAHPTWALEWPEVPQPANRGWCWGCWENRGLDADGNVLPHHRRDRTSRWPCQGNGRPPTHRVVWRSGRVDLADHEAGV